MHNPYKLEVQNVITIITTDKINVILLPDVFVFGSGYVWETGI